MTAGTSSKGSEAPPERVMILEQNPIGHHFYYVRLLVDEVTRRGQRAVLATPVSATSTPEFRLHLGGAGESFDLHRIGEAPLTMEGLADAARTATAACVVVPDGDRLTMRLGRSPRRGVLWPVSAPPLALLVMRDHGQDAGLPALAPLKTFVKSVLMRRADNTEGVRVVALKPSGWRGKNRVAVAIDPVTLAATEDDRTAASARLVQAGGPATLWLGVFGALTSRKNLPMIADAVLESGRTDVGLAVLGHFDEGVRAACEPHFQRLVAAGHPLMAEDGWLGEGELDAFIGAVDCVVLAYSNEGPSGLLGKSIASGTRVLTAGARMLRQEARRYPGRAVWTPLSARAMSRAILLLPTARNRNAISLSDVDGFASPLLDHMNGDPR